MAEIANVRLSGWKAAALAVGILGWSAWGFVRHMQPVPEPAREALQSWLVADYTAPEVHHHRLGLASDAQGGAGAVVTLRGVDMSTATVPVDSAQVTLESVDGHGWKDLVIAQAKIVVRTPDQTVVHAVRYLDLARGRSGDWRVAGESAAWNYWWALVPAPRNGSSWP